MWWARRSVVRGLSIASAMAVGFIACSVDDEDKYVFGEQGGAPSIFPSQGGSSNGFGGTSSAVGGSTSSRGGTASVPEGGEAGSGSSEAPTGSGGRTESGGTSGLGSGGSTPSSAGASGAAQNSADAGAAGDPSGPCAVNRICAAVSVPSAFPSGSARLVVVLYEAEPVITGQSLPWPLATYPVREVELTPGEDFAFQRDFTSPSWGENYTGQRYVAVVAFFSNEPRQARPGIDYWSVLPAPVAIATGTAVELGQVQLSAIPIPNDPDTPGHEGSGAVQCVGRRHEQRGDQISCDVTANTCCIYEAEGGKCSSAACAGNELEHSCDGPEDCGEGQVCCGAPMQAHRCVAASACSARPACHMTSDCADASSVCAPAIHGIADIGYCVTADPSTPGDDRPRMIQCSPSDLVCSLQCCVDEPQSAYSCAQPNGVCAGTSETRVSFLCDGPEDCSVGEQCCLSTGRYCTRNCASTVICHDDNDCPTGQCGANGECS